LHSRRGWKIPALDFHCSRKQHGLSCAQILILPVLQLDIEEKVKLAKETEIQISGAREVYRPVAARGSLMYFLIDNINTLDRVYHYSMANFVFILRKGMDVTPGGPDESKVPPAQRLEEEVRSICVPLSVSRT
jgi:hypothetical protein